VTAERAARRARRAVPVSNVLLVIVLAVVAAACRKPPVEPLQLDGSRLFVTNDSAEPWHDIEIRINRYYWLPVSAIAAHQRFEVPLSSFVTAYSQRFNAAHMQITSLTLAAKRPDGTRVELNKQFEDSGLAKYFKGNP
jgi:hypothetical protein